VFVGPKFITSSRTCTGLQASVLKATSNQHHPTRTSPHKGSTQPQGELPLDHFQVLSMNFGVHGCPMALQIWIPAW
jgi:hypothetical protein